MFLGCYDAAARELDLLQCRPPAAHPASASNGSISRLDTSGTVVGLFDGEPPMVNPRSSMRSGDLLSRSATA
jgi:serine phosphatase RsbU (regulator of sigma subunit)